MIPFQLHRRVPLVRRPFFQRDQAIRERDALIAERDAAQQLAHRAMSELSETIARCARERREALERQTTFAFQAGDETDRPREEMIGRAEKLESPFVLPPAFQSFSVSGDGGSQF